MKPVDAGCPHHFVMAGIDGAFPKPALRDQLREWCLDNAGNGEFRIRWYTDIGQLTVAFEKPNAAFAFKMRHQEDIVFEADPMQGREG